MLLSDGDTGWHIRTGEWILKHGAVPRVDLFSFTKPHQPWFAWEWAWDVLFAVIHQAWGLSGVAFVNVLVLGLFSVLLFRLIRRYTDNDVLSIAFTLLALIGSLIHWHARPHLFSWLLVLIFLHVLLSVEKGNSKALYWLPLVTLIWTNIHGSFFIGIALLVTSAAAEALQVAFEPGGSWAAASRKSRQYLVCAAGCALVTFINPYGWHLHQHIVRYLSSAKLMDNIQEYQSISFHHAPATFFECMLVLGVAGAVRAFQKRCFFGPLSILLWAHLGLVSARNIPIFLMIAAPYAAAVCVDALNHLKTLPWTANIGSVCSEIAVNFKTMDRVGRWHLVSLAAIAFISVSFASSSPGFRGEFNPKSFPASGIPVIEAAHISRLFTSDQWGDYLIYRDPARRVFMDGRSDFYGDDFVTLYQHIVNANYDWESNLRRYAVDAVMVKPDDAIATALKESPRWKLLFDDGSVVIFRATATGAGKQLAARLRITAQPTSGSAGNKLGGITGRQEKES